ncbi:hypothetical protein HYX70_04975 [Candidatus Saccharibacteria bacterium]|nr:hypothetical protein [Candidatus Saccharibacteria bacterium]
MTATTETPRPRTQPTRPTAPDGPDNGPKILAIVGVVAVVLVLASGLWLLTRGDDGEAQRAQQREATRSKAEAVLRARFNDTNPSVGPLQVMVVKWDGDTLVADWIQGDKVQKKCHAPVVIGADGQSFGVERFDPVPFANQDKAKATCVATDTTAFARRFAAW